MTDSDRTDKYFSEDEPVDVEAAWQRFEASADEQGQGSRAAPRSGAVLPGHGRAKGIRFAVAASVIAAAVLAAATLSPIKTVASDLLRILHLSSVEEIDHTDADDPGKGSIESGASPLGRLTYVPSGMSDEVERPNAQKLLGEPLAEPQSLPPGYISQSVMALSEEKISLELDRESTISALKGAGKKWQTVPSGLDGAVITRVIPPSVIIIYSDPKQSEPSGTAIMLAQRKQPVLRSTGVDLDYVRTHLIDFLPGRLKEQLSIKDWESALPIETDPSRTKTGKVRIGGEHPGIYFSQAQVHGVTWNAGGRTFTLATSPSTLTRGELELLAASVPPKP